MNTFDFERLGKSFLDHLSELGVLRSAFVRAHMSGNPIIQESFRTLNTGDKLAPYNVITHVIFGYGLRFIKRLYFDSTPLPLGSELFEKIMTTGLSEKELRLGINIADLPEAISVLTDLFSPKSEDPVICDYLLLLSRLKETTEAMLAIREQFQKHYRPVPVPQGQNGLSKYDLP
jgi:hypothetical protein